MDLISIFLPNPIFYGYSFPTKQHVKEDPQYPARGQRRDLRKPEIEKHQTRTYHATHHETASR